MPFKFNLSDTVEVIDSAPLVRGVIDARIEYASQDIKLSYRLRYKNSAGLVDRVWYNEDRLTSVASTPPTP